MYTEKVKSSLVSTYFDLWVTFDLKNSYTKLYLFKKSIKNDSILSNPLVNAGFHYLGSARIKLLDNYCLLVETSQLSRLFNFQRNL